MSSYEQTPDTAPDTSPTSATDRTNTEEPANTEPAPASVRVGTVVWGLIILALAVLIIVAQLGLVVLNGTYVLIGLMLGSGAALVVGGLLSARGRDKKSITGKS